jgi:hypothetical protein
MKRNTSSAGVRMYTFRDGMTGSVSALGGEADISDLRADVR